LRRFCVDRWLTSGASCLLSRARVQAKAADLGLSPKQLQRMGIGLVVSMFAMLAAGVLELVSIFW
jgi:hypothetical protein